MMNYEEKWDKHLHIKTTGRDDILSDQYRYPYEPTPYSVLERLADSGMIDENDVVVDYGCGKGRVGLFLSHRTKANTIGIEYDERMYCCALENSESASSQLNANFLLCKAEAFELPKEVNRCYFFNPFSVEILQKVMAKILQSYYDHPRQILLFFYYPSDEYVSYLMSVDELDFYDEIECDDLFSENLMRERILVFSLPNYYE